jgi:hypothetical protein
MIDDFLRDCVLPFCVSDISCSDNNCHDYLPVNVYLGTSTHGVVPVSLKCAPWQRPYFKSISPLPSPLSLLYPPPQFSSWSPTFAHQHIYSPPRAVCPQQSTTTRSSAFHPRLSCCAKLDGTNLAPLEVAHFLYILSRGCSSPSRVRITIFMGYGTALGAPQWRVRRCGKSFRTSKVVRTCY